MDNVVCCFCGLGLRAESAVSLIAFPPRNPEESQNFWAHAGCFATRLDPSVPVHPDLVMADVDVIADEVRKHFPELLVSQLKVTHPADDDGIWFFHLPAKPDDDIQIESSSGFCPFLIENNRDDSRLLGQTVEEVASIICQHFNGTDFSRSA